MKGSKINGLGESSQNRLLSHLSVPASKRHLQQARHRLNRADAIDARKDEAQLGRVTRTIPFASRNGTSSFILIFHYLRQHRSVERFEASLQITTSPSRLDKEDPRGKEGPRSRGSILEPLEMSRGAARDAFCVPLAARLRHTDQRRSSFR